ncbi:hypothetical protein CFB82_12295 [Burkholderia sp. HI2714]|uniref:hypothetical protein n=1 Tax=Burkholderia sp. HI2714 TaxID=2015359 RepID=UPI000B7A4A61|nr:hypothetical protein [Burkholderia sp. HI2714]OXJ36013.1 hypothetical protein CFB82_12295 [Burkholderia sp. HI2714]
MNALLTGVVTGCLAIVGVILTSYLTRKREYDADWRKTKLEHYREYVAALSGVIEGRSIPAAAHERYADALNALALVASGEVLAALYAYQDETTYRNADRSRATHDRLLNDLLRTMRDDVQPNTGKGVELPPFRLIGVPPLTYADA